MSACIATEHYAFCVWLVQAQTGPTRSTCKALYIPSQGLCSCLLTVRCTEVAACAVCHSLHGTLVQQARRHVGHIFNERFASVREDMMFQCMQYATDRMEDACLPLNDMVELAHQWSCQADPRL